MPDQRLRIVLLLLQNNILNRGPVALNFQMNSPCSFALLCHLRTRARTSRRLLEIERQVYSYKNRLTQLISVCRVSVQEQPHETRKRRGGSQLCQCDTRIQVPASTQTPDFAADRLSSLLPTCQSPCRPCPPLPPHRQPTSDGRRRGHRHSQGPPSCLRSCR